MKYRGIDAYTGKAVIGQYVALFGLPTIVVNDSHVLIKEGSLEKFIDGKWRKVEK